MGIWKNGKKHRKNIEKTATKVAVLVMGKD